MPRFRVMLQGGPVFLFDVESKKIERLGFFTTRWVTASTAAEAEEIARKAVLEELAANGTRNPPGLPVEMRIEEVATLSWTESLRHTGTGRVFSFYPDDSN